MFKRITAVLLACSGTAGMASLVDHGDYTNFPNVNVDAHLRIIACKHFPEIRATLPQGLARRQAWTQDIKQAAAKLNVPATELDKLIKSVLDPKDAPQTTAPHPALEEFVLYVKGYRELALHTQAVMPVSWQKLLAMPVKNRRYTTIPVLYTTYRNHAFNQVDIREETLVKIQAAIQENCLDTQGCLLALIKDTGRRPSLFPNELQAFRRLFRKQFANYVPQKPWRYTNERDIFSWARFRGDRMYSGEELPDLIYALYTAKVESLAYYGVMDEALRDLIVGVTLTNRNFSDEKRQLGLKLGKASLINYPVLALRLPPAEAQKLLQGHKEFDQLRMLLQLKELTGEAKIAAIDSYVAQYPDYTPEDMPRTSLALNTHAELHALAGAELFKLGRPLEAAERWLKGCTPEDMGMVAEQVMTTDELIKFCDKYFPQGVTEEQAIYSDKCAKNTKLLYPHFIDRDQLNYMLRNLLARRLMREGRSDEAEKYFTGQQTRALAKKYFHHRRILNDPATDRAGKLAATLNLAALLRNHGDKLTGTFLEPDNLICGNNFPCQWGTKQKAVKLNKPDLPRYSYRYRAAELYARAATMTNDKKLQSHAWYMAGTLLKNRAPQQADIYFKQLWHIAPELTDQNWFLPKKSAPWQLQQFFHRKLFAPNGINTLQPQQPEITPVKIPQNCKTADELYQQAMKLVNSYDDQEIQQAMYMLKLAGDQGSAQADIWSAIIQYAKLQDYESALWFLQRSARRDPNSNLLKHELGHVYSVLGYWPEAVKLIREVADTETQDQLLLGTAAWNMANIYYHGTLGEPVNPQLGKHYLDKAIKADFEPAKSFTPPHTEVQKTEVQKPEAAKFVAPPHSEVVEVGMNTSVEEFCKIMAVTREEFCKLNPTLSEVKELKAGMFVFLPEL